MDIQRALDDFDGDTKGVAEVLLVFLDELELNLNLLADAARRGPPMLAPVLHELANSLESAWCFDGGKHVRAVEVQCRADETAALEEPEAIYSDVREILLQAAGDIQAWLRAQAER